MKVIADIAELEKIYDLPPSDAAMQKVATSLTPLYRKLIMASRFCVLTTVGPDGTDGSPRGDDGPVVTEINPKTLAMPDWRGNNRIDSLRNIISDGRVSLMFMIAQSNTIVRVNGWAQLTADPKMTSRFEQGEKHPRSVILIQISEVYTQCARALLRSRLWSAEDQTQSLPSIGDILVEMTEGQFDGQTYDVEWTDRAAKTMW
jgi:PPOX class probable FMN-dependent enzyme